MQPLTMWEPTTVTTTYIDVPDHNYRQNISDLIKHIGIKDSDGTIHIKAVDSVTDITDGYRIDFSSDPFATAPTDVKDAAPAWLCRFGSDTLKQTWATDTVSNSPISIVQVLNEKTVSLSNM